MLRVSGQIDQALMDMGLEDELPRINQARNEMRMRHLQWALFYKLEPYYKKKKVEIRAAIDSASALNGQERTDVITALQGRSNTLQTEEKSLGEVRDRAGSYAETLGILENSPVFSEEERGAMLQEVRPELEHIKHFDEHGTFLRPEVWTEGFPQEK